MEKKFGVLVPGDSKAMTGSDLETGFMDESGQTKVTPQKILQQIYKMADNNSKIPTPEYQVIGFKCWELLGKHFKMWSDKGTGEKPVNLRSLVQAMRDLQSENDNNIGFIREERMQLDHGDQQ